MKTFSALLAICAGNSPVTYELSAQRLLTRNFDVLFQESIIDQNRNGARKWNQLSRFKNTEIMFLDLNVILHSIAQLY